MPLKREDDFTERKKYLQNLSNEELKERFWKLTEEIVDPLLELARTHTSQSIERSVLLRMGFSSMDTQSIVKKIVEAELLGKGVGHVVLKLGERENMPVKDAGLAITRGEYSKEDLQSLFNGGEK